MADPQSMKSAIYTAIDIYHRREQFDQLQKNKL